MVDRLFYGGDLDVLRSGSLYVYCDPTASHNLKAFLHSIFGPTPFQNESRRRCARSGSRR